MNVLKCRDNTKDWAPQVDEARREILIKEVNKVAPCWVEDPPPLIERVSDSLYNQKDNLWGLNSKFTAAELDRALSSCRDKSSPGVDGIDYKMLRLCPGKFKEKLLDRLNYAFTESYMYED